MRFLSLRADFDVHQARRPAWARIVALPLALLAAASTSLAATSLTMDLAAPGSTDVVVRWASDASGPFTILRRELAPDQLPATALPLDPTADAWMSGLSGPSLLLPGEAVLDVASGARTACRVYQVIDASGGCSNAGYVLARSPGGPLSPVGFDVVSLPARSSIHDARSFLEHVPQAQRVELWQARPFRPYFLERVADGSFFGMNFRVVPSQALRVRYSALTPFVLVGAADSRAVVHASPGAMTRYGTPSLEDIALPWGSRLLTADEALCGARGVHWTDVDGDGDPDGCPAGLTGPNDFAVSVGTLVATGGATATRTRRGIGASGSDFAFVPSVGITATFTAWDVADRVLDPVDAGADPACACADTDGDDWDDCTERLDGSDPADPASFGPDSDADGVRDPLDACPSVPDPSQAQSDFDGTGDACDPCPLDLDDLCQDEDFDGRRPGDDNCPGLRNGPEIDDDFDTFGNSCDNCPSLANDQLDFDGDGIGDACDSCPDRDEPDADRDGTCDDVDNCLGRPNDQRDRDRDGFGDGCDCYLVGNHLPEVTGLRIRMPTTGVPFVRLLTWNDGRAGILGDNGCCGTHAVWFDVMSGRLSDLHADRGFAAAECLEAFVTTPETHDAITEGSIWYLVSMGAVCWRDEWGSSSWRGSPDPRSLLESYPACR